MQRYDCDRCTGSAGELMRVLTLFTLLFITWARVKEPDRPATLGIFRSIKVVTDVLLRTDCHYFERGYNFEIAAMCNEWSTGQTIGNDLASNDLSNCQYRVKMNTLYKCLLYIGIGDVNSEFWPIRVWNFSAFCPSIEAGIWFGLNKYF